MRISCPFFFVALIIGILAIYGPGIRDDHLIAFDDPIVVVPMRDVRTLSDYTEKRARNEIIDLQPVRDLTYAIDYRTGEHFHATNSALWTATGALLYLILVALGIGETLAAFIALAYAFDPIFVNTVAWASARKHLLATLFTFAATLLLVRHRRRIGWGAAAGILATYTLACFSQPLNVLWPAFAVLYLYGARKFETAEPKSANGRAPEWTLLAAGMAIAILCLALNYLYYTDAYLLHSGGAAKVLTNANEEVTGARLLALGRYFFQIVFPYWPSIWDHYPGSPQNLAGLFLLPVFLSLFFKFRIRLATPWLTLALLSLLPVLVRMTNVFATDNYLLVAGAGVFIAIAQLLEHLPSRNTWPVLGVLLLVALTTRSVVQARAWSSEDRLWETAYAIEPTPKNARELGVRALLRGDAERAYALALDLREWNPGDPNLAYLLCQSIARLPKISLAQKFTLLDQFAPKDAVPAPWCTYTRATLRAEAGDFRGAQAEFAAEKIDTSTYRARFGDALEAASAEREFICARSEASACGALTERFRTLPGWSEARYRARAQALGQSRNEK